MELATWVAAIVALGSLIVSAMALNTSRSALKTTQSVEQFQQTIELALNRFQDELTSKRLLVNPEAIDYRFLGEDDKIKQLDHRTTRNTDQITLILRHLLLKGIEVRSIDQS